MGRVKTASARTVTLNAKLSVPPLSGTMARDRFNPFFGEIAHMRVVSVVAGAGYGKTTLVAQACRHLKMDTVWYRLDASDQDPIAFIHYLIAGIGRFYDGFGRQVLGRIEAAQSIKHEQHAILSVLIKELETCVDKDLIVVFDDFHLVQPSSAIREAVTFLLDNLPHGIHLVIVSRSVPDLPLARLIAGGQAMDMGEKDLAFLPAETASLFEKVFGIHLEDEHLTTLCRKTDGWITGLILFNYAIRRKGTGEISAHLDKLHGTSGFFFNYLEENIYHSLSDEVTQFLKRTAILSRLDIGFCNRLLDIGNAGEILDQLERAHLLTFPFDESKTAYYYHHLFKDFLQAKLKRETDPADLGNLHGRAAELWEASDEPVEAIGHYLCAGLFEKACKLLSSIGTDLIRGGRSSRYLSYYHAIPDRFIDRYPWLIYMYGRALEFSGDTHAAIRAYEQAHKHFKEMEISKGTGLSLNRSASSYYVLGQYSEAEKKFKLLLDQARTMPRRYVDALGHLVFISSHVGKLEEADRYADAAMAVLPKNEETDLHAWILLNQGFRYIASGDFQQARACGDRAIAIVNRFGLDRLKPLGCHLLSVTEYHAGDRRKALELSLKGVEVCEQMGIVETTYAWNLTQACFGATSLGRYAEAITFGNRSLTVCRTLESAWSEAWAHRALTEAYLNSGDLAQAEASARAAVEIIGKLDLPFDTAVMKERLAAVLLEKGRPVEAFNYMELLPQTLQQFKAHLAAAHVLFARYYLEQNDGRKAERHMKEALLLGEKYRHARWLIRERHWIIPLLVPLHRDPDCQNYIDRLFEQFGWEAFLALRDLHESSKGATRSSAAAILRHLKALPPPELHITCFGKFTLRRGNVDIPPDRWLGKKPKQLFQYLCYHHAKGFVTRDELLELLWPEEDPAATSKRLHVALTKLRRTLEPELTRGMPSSYLLRNGETYRLAIGEGGYLDIATFDRLLADAQKEKDEDRTLALYLKAEAHYAGPLFDEEPYTSWCNALRAAYQQKYLNLLDLIITGYRGMENWRKCIDYAQRYVAIDPYAEELYQAMMVFYHAMGNKSMIAKTYEDARNRLERELDCLLSDATTDLYKELIAI